MEIKKKIINKKKKTEQVEPVFQQSILQFAIHGSNTPTNLISVWITIDINFSNYVQNLLLCVLLIKIG